MEQRRAGPRHLKLADCVGVIVLVAAVATIALGVWLFPLVKDFITSQDCIASGRTDCGRNSDR